MALPAGETRRRRMERGERREAILAAARKVIAAVPDVESVAIEEIAEQAGISRALVYEYFGDRARLIDELRSRLAAELAEEMDASTARAVDAHTLLTELADAHLRFAEAGIGTYRLARSSSLRFAAEVAARLGGGDDGRLIAAVTVEGLCAFASEWAAGSELERERAVALIVSFLEGGLNAVRRLPSPAGVRDHGG